MVEHDGRGRDTERVSQLSDKIITRADIVQVGELCLARGDVGRAQQQRTQRQPLQEGHEREKPRGGGGRPDVDEVDAGSLIINAPRATGLESAKPRQDVTQ